MEDKKTFEQSIMELAEIVRKLDNGQTPLDEAMELFEKGVRLTKECNNMLDEAEQKINILLKNSDGEVVAEKMSQ